MKISTTERKLNKIISKLESLVDFFYFSIYSQNKHIIFALAKF